MSYLKCNQSQNRMLLHFKTDSLNKNLIQKDMKKKREIIIQQREQQLARERKAKLDEETERKKKKERQKTQVSYSIKVLCNNIFYLTIEINSNRFKSYRLPMNMTMSKKTMMLMMMAMMMIIKRK